MNTKYTTYSVSNNQILIQKMNTIHSIQDKLLGNLYDKDNIVWSKMDPENIETRSKTPSLVTNTCIRIKEMNGLPVDKLASIVFCL